MARSVSMAFGAVVAALLASAPVSAADMGLARAPAETGFTSENVEWVSVMPQHTGTSGGKLVGKHYYMTDPRGVYIYDVSEPAAPTLVGELPAVQLGLSAALAQEDPDTNGRILLVNGANPDAASNTGAGGALLVVDVRDKANPTVIGSLNISDHTWTCILDCKYAIGRTGHIIDLRDPTAPERVADWREHVGISGYMHDFEEVAPGRLIGAGQPSLYLDMTNPLKPTELTRFDPGFYTFGYHGAAWPNNAKDPLLVMGAEIPPQGATAQAGSDCAQESAHALATYDARDVIKLDRKEFGSSARVDETALQAQRARTTFRKLEEWRVAGRGVYADGNAPAHTEYCGHWFDPHPDWRAGGLLAIAHYDWGTRFLNVERNGKMEEIGWFQPVGGHTSSAEWIDDEIVYVHDYRRGLDILRFTGRN